MSTGLWAACLTAVAAGEALAVVAPTPGGRRRQLAAMAQAAGLTAVTVIGDPAGVLTRDLGWRGIRVVPDAVRLVCPTWPLDEPVPPGALVGLRRLPSRAGPIWIVQFPPAEASPRVQPPRSGGTGESPGSAGAH
ncbi:MAG: hypothetical protein OWV35_07510 [Firmicutes bacterium]|nr:hypothetical protein [Bacillota bacterium]